MKKLPISIQTFEKIREDDLVYVDKTEYVWKMVNNGKYYFLSRPRRFGKSLFLTTLKSYFTGRKDLFTGLFIAKKEKKWETFPVIHLDYSLVDYRDSKERFESSLLSNLQRISNGFDLELKEKVISNAFIELVEKLHKKSGKVVLLIDEYDKPLVDKLADSERFMENKQILSQLYGTIKGLDAHFRFVLLTGVSRFSKVNIFSGMNNLDDISLTPFYSNITGFSRTEIQEYFAEHLEKVAQRFNTPIADLMEAVKSNYNGFSWDGQKFLYNPFSFLKFISDKEFGNYWFSSGTPTFLVDLIKNKSFIPEELENTVATDLEGGTQQPDNLPIVPLLFQTGYLTIKKVEYVGYERQFTLSYPNEEVRSSFIRYLAAGFVNKTQADLQPEAVALQNALRHGDIPKFITKLQSFFADIPARLHIPKEAYYHSLVYMLLRLVGVQLLLEKETSKGRIDAVLEFSDKIYIIEFKFGKEGGRIKNVETLAKKAIAQIKENRYIEPYLSVEKQVILLGIGFLNKKLAAKTEII